jgi:hypothetical protein
LANFAPDVAGFVHLSEKNAAARCDQAAHVVLVHQEEQGVGLVKAGGNARQVPNVLRLCDIGNFNNDIFKYFSIY